MTICNENYLKKIVIFEFQNRKGKKNLWGGPPFSTQPIEKYHPATSKSEIKGRTMFLEIIAHERQSYF